MTRGRNSMRSKSGPMIALLLLMAAEVISATPASARGGGAANLLNSPGYQRALQESRERYRREAQPAPSPAVKPRKPKRHRAHH